jgi:AcrR family transcriptional regulator
LIVAKAAELFERVGYHNATIADIAHACAMRKPTFYHYYRGKDELLYDIHDEFIGIVLQRERDRENDPESRSPTEALFAVVQDIFSVLETHRAYVKVFFEHLRELGPEQRRSIEEKRGAYEAIVRTHIERGIESGELRPMDSAHAARALLGMCNWAYHWYRPDGSRSSRELAELYWNFIFFGFKS